MRKTTLWIAAALITAPLATSAFAQQADPYAPRAMTPPPAPQAVQPAMPLNAPMPPGAILVGADSIIGSKVRDADGSELGQVKQLMIRPEDGRIQYAIMTLGGVLGVGGQQVAVPWASMKVARDEKNNVVITAERQVLSEAPRYNDEAEANANVKKP
jgi:sporulation protein YlmC with PRC-barrel domain